MFLWWTYGVSKWTTRFQKGVSLYTPGNNNGGNHKRNHLIPAQVEILVDGGGGRQEIWGALCGGDLFSNGLGSRVRADGPLQPLKVIQPELSLLMEELTHMTQK